MVLLIEVGMKLMMFLPCTRRNPADSLSEGSTEVLWPELRVLQNP